MKTIKKIGEELSEGINFIFDAAEYVARLALLIGAVLYIISFIFQIKTLETYSLAALIGAALFLIPALIVDIEYNTKQARRHLERLDYMMFHSVYNKDDNDD